MERPACYLLSSMKCSSLYFSAKCNGTISITTPFLSWSYMNSFSNYSLMPTLLLYRSMLLTLWIERELGGQRRSFRFISSWMIHMCMPHFLQLHYAKLIIIIPRPLSKTRSCLMLLYWSLRTNKTWYASLSIS